MAELHPESISFLESTKGLKTYDQLGVAEARKASVKGALAGVCKFDYEGDVTEVFIPSDNVTDGIPTSIYKPKHCGPKPTILVFFHGGGMVVGTRQNMDIVCKVWSSRASCIVVNVEYRLAPEHLIPAQMEDGETVVRWVIGNKTKIGGNEESIVGVSGDSAGGTIAASVAHDVPGIGYQVLIYPHLDLSCSLPSYQTYANGPFLTNEMMKWFKDLYLPPDVENVTKYFSLNRPSFSNLPPAMFIVAECDPLCDDSFAYSKKMTEAGVPNELFLVKGAIHAFFHKPGLFKECCAEAYAKATDFIIRHS